MDPRLQRRVQRYGWDKAAAHYERFWQEQLAPAQRKLLEFAALRPGERVAETAAGTGLVTFPAAAAVAPDGTVTATDLSEEMVTALTAEAARRGLSNVTVARMDAEELRLPDAAFDAALCALGLMYLPDPVAALREMHRVLRPGGRAAVAVWGARERCGWAEIFPIVDRRVSSEVCPMFFQMGGREALSMALETAGLTDLVLERITTVLHYRSADEAIGAAFIGGPVALAHSRFDETTRNEAYQEYLDSIAAWKQGAGYAVPVEFVVARGMRPLA